MDFADKEAEPKILEIRNSLDQWVTQLPSTLQINNLTPDQKSFRGAVHLHMNYNQIIIYMGRTALLRRIQAHLHRIRDEAHGTAAPEAAGDKGRYEAEERLSRDCVNAAYRIIDYIRYLFELKRLARFSFTDFHCCTSAAIIIMIHEVIQRHPRFNLHMAGILKCMQFMASGCENARISLKVIENIHSMTAAIKDKHPPPPMGDEQQPVGETEDQPQQPHRTGYEQWETWMAEAGNWSISSRKQSDVSRLAAATENVNEWRVETVPAIDYADDDATPLPTFNPMFRPDAPRYGPPTLPNGLVYNWPDDLNSLGLIAFEGLEFATRLT